MDTTTTLTLHARQLYDDLRLAPMLRQLMATSCALIDAAGGSISIVDNEGERYTKVAERGTACRLGQSFPLHEGVTGRVIARRGPVVLASYRDVRTGHLPMGHPARDGAVVAIPIWWRGDVIGANVVFAGGPRRFTVEEVDQLEVLTQVVAPGLVTAAQQDLGISYALRNLTLPSVGERAATYSSRETGARDDSEGVSVAQVAILLMELAERAAVRPGGSGQCLPVAVVTSDDGPHLLVREGCGEQEEPSFGRYPEVGAGWRELVDSELGDVRLGQPFPGGSGVDGPLLPAARRPTDPRGEPAPFTPRERDVAALLAQGMSDRAIAKRLLISSKTVEKHVGAVLRKTGTTSRTAAVVRALEQGWLPPGGTPS